MKTAGSRREKRGFFYWYCVFSLLTQFQAASAIAAGPPNDQFASRITLLGNNPQAAGSTANGTVQAGEPAHGEFPGGVSVWWSWTAPASGPCVISTEGSTFYTLLAVYSGNLLTNLARVTAAPTFSGANGTSLTEFHAMQGVTYAIAVDGYYGATGRVQLTLQLATPASVNSWTKTASGDWEESYWSLSARPGVNQSLVCVTNAGSKSVTIGAQTVSTAPGSLLISNLSLSAPAGALNTLALNNSGSANPLRVAGNLGVQANARVSLQSAGLRVGEGGAGGFYLGGTMNQSGASDAHFSTAHIGYGQPGHYDLSNGVVTAQEMIVGGVAAGTMNQYGGVTRVAGAMAIRNAGGLFSLKNGTLNVNTLQAGQGSGSVKGRFQQVAGNTVVSNALVIGDISYLNAGSGSVELSGGKLTSPLLAGQSGSVVQTGGTNSTTTVQMGAPNGFVYNLAGGLWQSSDDYLGYHGAAVVNQTGGSHEVANSLYVFAYGGYSGQGTYNLTNGALKASALYLGARGTLNQAGGSISLRSTLGVGNGSIVRLMGGTILTPRTTVGDWSLEDYPTFTQSGGTHVATNEFVLNAGSYRLLKGSLTASNVSILSGVFTNGGGLITNRGTFTLAGGTFYPGAYNLQLGKLKVDGQAKLDFAGGASVVRFGASAGVNWYDYGALTVEHWRGSTAGGGVHRIICGTTQNGLTTQQLSKIVFRNPAGFPAGSYPAFILASGEVVPVGQQQQEVQPRLSQALVGRNLVFSWDGDSTLQTATNVMGPYEDVAGATSPYTNNITSGPIRFFRLIRY